MWIHEILLLWRASPTRGITGPAFTIPSQRGEPLSLPRDVHDLKKAEPRWIPNDALLEKSHSTWRKGALTCVNCHSPNEVIDWKSLGYTEDEIETLESDPLE